MADYCTLKNYAEKILQTNFTLISEITQEQNTQMTNNLQI